MYVGRNIIYIKGLVLSRVPGIHWGPWNISLVVKGGLLSAQLSYLSPCPLSVPNDRKWFRKGGSASQGHSFFSLCSWAPYFLLFYWSFLSGHPREGQNISWTILSPLLPHHFSVQSCFPTDSTKELRGGRRTWLEGTVPKIRKPGNHIGLFLKTNGEKAGSISITPLFLRGPWLQEKPIMNSEDLEPEARGPWTGLLWKHSLPQQSRRAT